MTIKLRDYQTSIIARVQEAWSSGATNVAIQLSTGGGKTVVFSALINMLKVPTITIAHRSEIVSQVSLTLARYGIRHNIVAQKNIVREIIALHLLEFNKSFYDAQSQCHVAGVDTLLRMDVKTAWFKKIKLVVQDEAHHVLKDNKWGKAAGLFPNARGIYPTATPIRADGKGLGRHANGIIDALIVGPQMRNLINEGFLTRYRIVAPKSDIDLTQVPIAAGGDYSLPKLRTAVHKSHITGDVVKHYLKFARGKLGVTFAVDIEAATEIAQAFREQGVSAEVITGKTPDMLRASIMRKFRNREIMQIVNVDLLGEGVDVPALEVVSMARPTQSYCLYSQQFGRALRPMQGKEHALIIDHVGNVIRHGLPDDVRRIWSLDGRAAKLRTSPLDVVPVKTCLNTECLAVYERTKRECPQCGYYTPPADRSKPEYVDGDLTELDESILEQMRGEIKRIDGAPRVPQHLDAIAKRAIVNRHNERRDAQVSLRNTIAQWAGFLKEQGLNDSEMYRQFYFDYGIDVASAQVLNCSDANDLEDKIKLTINQFAGVA